MLRLAAHSALVVLLTLATQIGGIAWLIALLARRRLMVFVIIYAGLSLASLWIAPMFGRVPLPCQTAGALRMQSLLYCATNRHYVSPELKSLLSDLAADVARQYPGTVTLLLDANLPYLTGFPLLPHLSHDDGGKADIAFYYRDGTGAYLPGKTRSPIGYFAFEAAATDCPARLLTLRWDLAWLQEAWPEWQLETQRMAYVLRWLDRDPRVGKVFLEPHLEQKLGLASEKIRFQGCRAARHDDHIHVQL